MAVLLFLAFVWLLPSLLSSPSLRDALEDTASRWAGGAVRYEEISVGLLPPSFQIEGIRVAGPVETDAPLFSAEQLSLELDLWTLVSGRLELGSLQVSGLQLRLVRTRRGFVLPVSPEPAAEPPGAGEAPAGEAALPLVVALREVAVRGARLRVEDRTLVPAGLWDYAFDLHADLPGLGAAIDVFADLEAESGGRIRAKGRLMEGRRIEAELEIEALALAAFDGYLGPEASLAGSLSGRVEVEGLFHQPHRLHAQWSVSDGLALRDDFKLEGAFSGRLDLEDPLSQPQGRFEVNAAEASIHYAGLVEKAPGVPAELSGRIVSDSQGQTEVEDLELKLRDFEARGALRPGPPPRLEVEADPVDLAGWGSLLPGLSSFEPTGSVELQSLRVDGDPLALYGSLRLRDVQARLAERAVLGISSELSFEGDVLRSRGTHIHLAGQAVELEFRVEDLFGAARFETTLRAEAVDSGALSRALGGRSGVIAGPLTARGELTGPLGEKVEGLEGRLDFAIENGTLAGVSLLEAVVEQMDGFAKLGAVAVEAGRIFGGRDLQRFYGDRFERLEGRLVVERGGAFMEPLRLIYRDYGVELRGRLDLVDLSLDARGVLTLYEPIDAAIARKVKAPAAYTPRRRQVSLAAVGGRLDDPRVRLDPEQLSGFVAVYASDLYRQRLGEMLEGKLGPGAGKVVDQGLQVLQGILDGRDR